MFLARGIYKLGLWVVLDDQSMSWTVTKGEVDYSGPWTSEFEAMAPRVCDNQ